MGAKSGLALKSLQWLVRAIQLLCAAYILGVYSYFLAALHHYDLPIPVNARAVEGIAAAAVLYTLVGLVLLCCVAGLIFASAVAVLVDVALAGAFIYVAYANRHGAGSCQGYLDTPFGSGPSGDKPAGQQEGFTVLPTFYRACRLQTGCLALSIAVIILFVLSAFIEVALVRHHRKEKRFGPGPANNYTSGYGTKSVFAGLASRFRRKPKAQPFDDPNALPEHTHPAQLNGVDHPAYSGANMADAGYGHQPHSGAAAYPHQPQPAAFQYHDGTYDRP